MALDEAILSQTGEYKILKEYQRKRLFVFMNQDGANLSEEGYNLKQAQIAIDTADVIVFLVDVKQGLVDADSKVADMLRRSQKPVVLAVNKVDDFNKYMADVYEFYNLGIGEPFAISSVNKLGFGELLDEVTSYFDREAAEEEEDERTKVAIVGKPNVGNLRSSTG